MSKPVAVIISDTHYTVPTLDVAHAAYTQALAKAEALGVPLVDAGDLMDSKAIIRAEVANRLIELFKAAKTRIILIGGNHTALNVHSSEQSLNFLAPYARVVTSPQYNSELDSWLIPYMHNPDDYRAALKTIPKGARIITHIGVQGADMGHYVQDKSALTKEDFKDYRVISGHYHKAQDIKCGPPRKGATGLFTYVGNPYTLSFSEANDGPKGFAVLNDDGTLDRIPTNLRKHIIIELDERNYADMKGYSPGDVVWVKVRGRENYLTQVTKKKVADSLFSGDMNFKFDKISTTSPTRKVAQAKGMTDTALLDALIDQKNLTDEHKAHLKGMWRKAATRD